MQKVLKAFVWVSFTIYFLVVIYIIFFWHRGDIWSNMSMVQYALFQMNLVPFKTISEYIKAVFDGSMNLSIPIQNLGGNLLMFFPLGIYLPLFVEKMKAWKRYLGTVLLLLIGIELVQFFTRRGSFDIDDLILNLAGAMLGFLMWKTKILQWFGRYIVVGGSNLEEV